ncbi:hypothetical protein PI95_006105, partial [Hassallia byssoidea VB512170]
LCKVAVGVREASRREASRSRKRLPLGEEKASKRILDSGCVTVSVRPTFKEAIALNIPALGESVAVFKGSGRR